MSSKIRPIAFYLPQFYPTPENDEWWEPGFTEWTNVARAKPLFKGHYQPRIPRDLGFYDLRVPETREKQVQLACEAGIEGFCYWHYWFGNGRRLLADVFREVVESGKPDFPFCLCWANHSWYQKTWDPTKPDKLLMEQTYPGVDDYKAHFMEMLPAFKDKRYIKVNNKLLFGIFSASDIPNQQEFFDTWNQLAKENGLNGFCFFALVQGQSQYNKLDSSGFDLVVYDYYGDMTKEYLNEPFIVRKFKQIKRSLFNLPNIISYTNYTDKAISFYKKNSHLVPCIDPDFDHTPRSGTKTSTLHGSTPQKWGELCNKVKDIVLEQGINNLLFIKAWNEWGEGNYLEPDRKYGKSYIEETAKAFTEIE